MAKAIPLYDEDFLLESDVARELFHEHARSQPIIDYHCHLPPEQVAQNYKFRSLSEIWLEGDHYKWRAMRTNGVSEKLITGGADDWSRFEAWAQTVPKTLRNPLYHWTHLELKDPFGVRDRLLDPGTARGIFDQVNAQLAREEFRAQGIMKHFKVVIVCTTDDPADDLSHHKAHRASAAHEQVRMYPTFRPDKALGLEDPAALRTYLGRLEATSGISIKSYATLLEALESRHTAFHELGCRLSDHGLETMYASEYSPSDVARTFARALAGEVVSRADADAYRSCLLYDLARLDHARGWTQQFHLGAIRNLNSRMQRVLGPDTGFDAIGDAEIAKPLARFLDRLDTSSELAKTIVYNLNPRDNEMMASLIGCFQDGSVAGKVQYGSAWWFLDQLDGMEKQMEALSNLGMLSRFVGMLTDSRSFLSYSRHEYFRRLLCNLLGRDVVRGRLPDDRKLLGEMVRDICFRNANAYFGLELPRNAPL
ncbi:MAG: glucuronate isomerase [Polyangiaceae bacterium]